MHLMKGSMGSGILGMPKAVQNGGLWFALAVTPVIGFICTYCVHMLVGSLASAAWPLGAAATIDHRIAKRTAYRLLSLPVQVVSAHELYHRERVPQLDFSEVAELGFKTGPKRTRFLSSIAK